jgi:hypothetical protein
MYGTASLGFILDKLSAQEMMSDISSTVKIYGIYVSDFFLYEGIYAGLLK